MNSVGLFLPVGRTDEELNRVVRGACEWVSWAVGGADSGPSRIYWYRAPDVEVQYEPEEWAQLAAAGGRPEGSWFIDYSDVKLVKRVLVHVAELWEDCLLFLDSGLLLTGRQFLNRVAEHSDWVWSDPPVSVADPTRSSSAQQPWVLSSSVEPRMDASADEGGSADTRIPDGCDGSQIRLFPDHD